MRKSGPAGAGSIKPLTCRAVRMMLGPNTSPHFKQRSAASRVFRVFNLRPATKLKAGYRSTRPTAAKNTMNSVLMLLGRPTPSVSHGRPPPPTHECNLAIMAASRWLHALVGLDGGGLTHPSRRKHKPLLVCGASARPAPDAALEPLNVPKTRAQPGDLGRQRRLRTCR